MRIRVVFRTAARWIASPWIIFAVALALRIVVLMRLVPGQSDRFFYRHNEAARVAWAIVSGYGFSSPWPNTPLASTAVLPPVYPCLLAGIFKLAGAYSYRSLWIAVVLNSIFSALTAVLILRIGGKVFSRWVGIVAAWVWACWLYELAVSVRLWESSLSTLLLMFSLLLLTRLTESRRVWLWSLFGGLAGVAALTNTTLLGLLPFFLFWLWITQRRRGQNCTGRVLVSMATALLVLLAWTVRNYLAFHQVIPVRDNFGLELWVGNHEGVTHLYDFSGAFPLADPTEFNRLGELRFMHERGTEAVRFIEQHPGTFFRLCAERVYSFWTAPDAEIWLPLSLAAWWGALLALRQKRTLGVPFVVILLVFPGVYYITHPWSTYRHPIEPVMLLLTANLVINSGWQRWFSKAQAGNSERDGEQSVVAGNPNRPLLECTTHDAGPAH